MVENNNGRTQLLIQYMLAQLHTHLIMGVVTMVHFSNTSLAFLSVKCIKSDLKNHRKIKQKIEVLIYYLMNYICSVNETLGICSEIYSNVAIHKHYVSARQTDKLHYRKCYNFSPFIMR